MSANHSPVTPEEVAENSSWLRGLARHLVDSQAAAEDIAQQTWEAALSAPRPRSLRPWLAEVLRNFALMRGRREGRLARREREAVAADGGHPLTAEELLARNAESLTRSEMERSVSEIVANLPEPYRSTVRWSYFDGISLAEVARRQGLPGSTVRSHLKRGLAQIRGELDRRFDDNRQSWNAALIPLAGLPRPIAKASLAKTIVTMVVAGAAATGGIAFLVHRMGNGPANENQGQTMTESPAITSPHRASAVPAIVVPGQNDTPAQEHEPGTISPPANIAAFDFEDLPLGGPPSNFLHGLVVACPPGSKSSRCMAGTLNFSNGADTLTKMSVSLSSVTSADANLISAYADTLVLSFDYWLGDSSVPLRVLVFDKDQGQNYTYSTSDFRVGQWGHAELRLVDFALNGKAQGRKMVEGDALRGLVIMGGRNANDLFYVDNIKIVRYQPDDLPSASTVGVLPPGN